jgi:DNA-cytosine methyltransferase
MNVLSLFDGMSCGQIALNIAGVKYDNYFASEIEKSAIKITQTNYPSTIQIGDVTKVSFKDGVLSTDNGNFEVGSIDLLIGGSPCQGFSLAGMRLNFNDPRSKLFFEYERLRNEINPKYFLLENVKMGKEHEDVISDRLGVPAQEINSSLVSAQNRKRLYWTNIPGVKTPKDKGLLLKDILESGAECNMTDISKFNPVFTKNYVQFDVSGKNYNSQQYRAFFVTGKFGCFPNARATTKRKLYIHPYKYRNLTQTECERLQTVPDGYTKVEGVSEGQALCALGNGWTVDVICNFFKHII